MNVHNYNIFLLRGMVSWQHIYAKPYGLHKFAITLYTQLLHAPRKSSTSLHRKIRGAWIHTVYTLLGSKINVFEERNCVLEAPLLFP